MQNDQAKFIPRAEQEFNMRKLSTVHRDCGELCVLTTGGKQSQYENCSHNCQQSRKGETIPSKG